MKCDHLQVLYQESYTNMCELGLSITTGVMEILIRSIFLLFALFMISLMIVNFNVNFDKGKGGQQIKPPKVTKKKPEII